MKVDYENVATLCVREDIRLPAMLPRAVATQMSYAPEAQGLFGPILLLSLSSMQSQNPPKDNSGSPQ